MLFFKMEHNVCVLLCFAAVLLWASHTAESCSNCCPPPNPPVCTSSPPSGCVQNGITPTEHPSTVGSSVYSYTVKGINGDDICLEKFSGKVLLIVNYAESCGFTEENLKGLSSLSQKYKSQGLVILVFPSNTFNQNPSGNEAGLKLAQDYPDFVVCSEVEVNGPCEEPLYTYLKETLLSNCGTKDIEWNFIKFLVNRQGVPVERFGKTYTFDSIDTSVKDMCCCCTC